MAGGVPRDRPLPNLRSLDLSNNNLFAEAVRVIGTQASRFSRLKRLNLSANPIGDEGLEVLADSLHGWPD